MRKVLIALATAGAALAVATPASAQYYGNPNYGYGNGYNNGGWGQVRNLQVRIDSIERQINMLDRRDRIRNRTADRLRNEANNIERRLRYAGRNGLNPYEANEIQVRIARLEQQVQYSGRGRWGNNAYGYNNYNGYNNGYYDRDRDGRDDRYEDDHGYRRDR
jgi:hypothetical protein